MLKLSITDQQLTGLLADGAVGVLPTDTLYGLVCRAADARAVGRLYEIKHRDAKPGTVIAASVEQLAELGIDKSVLAAASSFWPGPISVECANDLQYLTQDTGRNAYRVVSGPSNLVELLMAAGPLLTSSANQPGEPVADTIDQAVAYFGDAIDFCVDGGDLSGALPSSLVRVTSEGTEILRQGAGTINKTENS